MPRSPVCVDANVVVALVTAERFSHAALALWQELTHRDLQPVAPLLLRYEVTSTLRRKIVRGAMSSEDAGQALREALALDIHYLDPPGLSEQAFELAARFQRPAAYDAHYLALAHHLNCSFWTADERLYNSIRADCPRIRWLGAHRPES
ncbi:MAG: type II toxin-antitoxin system VapC family toxin [Anaerolineae bacterium]